MQTFLPYASFRRSASVLDRQRLGKQRVETMQIMNAISNPGTGWMNHPATMMWSPFACALMKYQVAVCEEWLSRGYKDTCLEKTRIIHREHCTGDSEAPPWLSDAAFHRSHRSNLLRKNPVWYGQLPGFQLPDDLEYVWPTKKGMHHYARS